MSEKEILAPDPADRVLIWGTAATTRSVRPVLLAATLFAVALGVSLALVEHPAGGGGGIMDSAGWHDAGFVDER